MSIDHDSKTFKNVVALGMLADWPRVFDRPLKRGLQSLIDYGFAEIVFQHGREVIAITDAGREELKRLTVGA